MIIALAMITRRRIVLVFMALLIGCYCQFITSSMKITARNKVGIWDNKMNIRHKLDKIQIS